MRLHILGICGTFMSGLAVLAKQSGFTVTGSDTNVYPPMSLQLKEQDITVFEGYDLKYLDGSIDEIIVGNVIKRGNPAMEYILNNHLAYTSGPAWLAENILKNRRVLAVSGTHGKTTTSSLLAFILDAAGLMPGFLIGGIPENFGISARMGFEPHFVIEADEYDSAFFDKRSKFMHYHPEILVLNNLEYDHADIFADLAQIKQQFHYLIRTIPGNGHIICNATDSNLADVLRMGCFTPVITFGQTGEWHASLENEDGSVFRVFHLGKFVGKVCWELIGMHNVYNALAAIAAAEKVNIEAPKAIEALTGFKNVKRRMEVKAKVKDILIYDDFAHHPTAIATTLAGLRAKMGKGGRLIAVVEFGSYTMRSGVHKDQIKNALSVADMVICKSTEMDWGLKKLLESFKQPALLFENVDQLIENLAEKLLAGDHVVIMSNSSFGGIHKKLIDLLERGR